LAGLQVPEKSLSLDALTTAITFAEAGELDLARSYLGVQPESGAEEPWLLPGFKVFFGTVAMPEPVPIPGVKIWCGTVSAG